MKNIANKDIKIREAEESDFSFFYHAKCEDENINWCGHTAAPQPEVLYDFFNSAVQTHDLQLNRTIFIVEKISSGEKIGYLYLDPLNSDSAEISIGIIQGVSGRGYGRQAVLELCDKANSLGFENIYATIREDNVRSQKMFQHAGFERTGNYKYQIIHNLDIEIKMLEFKKT